MLGAQVNRWLIHEMLEPLKDLLAQEGIVVHLTVVKALVAQIEYLLRRRVWYGMQWELWHSGRRDLLRFLCCKLDWKCELGQV